MKLSDILNEANPLAYKPRYDDEHKVILGSSKEWAKRMGLTQELIAQAMDKAMESPEFKKLTKTCPYLPSAQAKRLGTFVFDISGGVDKRYGAMFANINLMGQIRYQSARSGSKSFMTRGRLASLKPRYNEKNPADGLATTYINAFAELMKKPMVKMKVLEEQSKTWHADGHKAIAAAVKNYISKDGEGNAEDLLLAALKESNVPVPGAYVEQQSLEWTDGADGYLHVETDDGWLIVHKSGKVTTA